MSACPGRSGRYVPWSWGEVFTCDTCRGQVRQPHTVQPLTGSGYGAVYPIPSHESGR